MSLIRSFEREGNWLFRKRSYLPLVLFILVIPFVFTTDYSWVTPTLHLVFIALCVLICTVGFAIRMSAIGRAPAGTSGRNTGGQVADALNTTGMYSVVRHPLYLGNYLIWISIAIYTLNPYFVIIVSLLFWIYYERIMVAEEMHLERTYGESYLKWSQTVPSFIPSFKKYKPASLPFSWKAILPREENGVLASIIAFIYVDTLIDISISGRPHVTTTELVIGTAAILAVLTIRIVKKRTNIFFEEGR